MNPIEACHYMEKTGLPVKAEKTPYWINNPQWIDWQYHLKEGLIWTLYQGNMFIRKQSPDD